MKRHQKLEYSHEETSVSHEDLVVKVKISSTTTTKVIPNNTALQDVTATREYNHMNNNLSSNPNSKQNKSDPIPIAPVKGTTYRLISRNRKTILIRSNIPTPEELIARQFQHSSHLSMEDQYSSV